MTLADFSNNESSAPALVSLIVRTKNRPAFLQEALQSICRQTYPHIEIVIINDGGEDLGGVVAPYNNQVSALQLIQLPQSLGRSGAANQGLSAANGEFIGFLDDDDLLEAKHLEELVQFAQRHAAKVVYSATQVVAVDETGGNHDISVYSVPFDANHLRYENFIPIHSALFHRQLIADGVRFDTDFDFFEDWDFWLQLSQKNEFLHFPAISAIYRLHGNASGVHQQANPIPYLQIYKKWLAAFTTSDLFALLEKTHQWHNEAIAALQRINYQRLNEIGEQHSHAQKVVQLRDAQLAERDAELEQIKSTRVWRIYTKLSQ